ncbi:MAG: hypothetical protein AB7N91_24035 [Candidatus Tectimicrobiota bacterium]
MGAAEVIAFAEVHASKQWATLRQQLQARFDQWLDSLAQQWHEPPSTLSEVTATMWALRQQLMSGLTETIVAHVSRREHDRAQSPCPPCEAMLTARALVCRTVETMVGPLQLERPYFYCRSCRVGAYPADDRLGVVPGCTQLDMQRATTSVVTEVP